MAAVASTSPRTLRLLWLVPLALAVWTAVVRWAESYDDAFITFRYARQLAESGELAYNLGERVLGTTAPGFAVLLAGLTRLSMVSIPGWGTLTGVAALLASALVLGRLLRPVLAEAAGLAAAVFAASAILARWNVELLGGEFLPILALGLVASYLLLVGSRPVLAGLIAGLAAMLRLDAGLLIAVLAAASWLETRRFPTAFVAGAALPLTAWIGWLQLEFGAVVPQTLVAKRAETALATLGHAAGEARWLLRSFGRLGLAALLALAAYGAWVLGRRLPRPLPREAWALGAVALWIVLHEVLYQAIGVPFAPWYHLYLVNALLALGAVAAAQQWLAGRQPFLRAAAASALLVAPGVAYAAAQGDSPPDPRIAGYAEAGRYLRAASARPTTVAAYEIGALGWSSEATVVDLMGLVTPAAAAARAESRLTPWLLERAPCWIVDATVFPRREFGFDFTSPELAARYELATRIADSRGAGHELNLLRQRGGNC